MQISSFSLFKYFPINVNDVTIKIIKIQWSSDRFVSDYWLFLEVDLDYTDEPHDWHNDYPLAGEKKTNWGNVVQISTISHAR